MSTSAQAVFAQAPLGALVRWSDGLHRPPARHVRKTREWERRNGQGRLVGRDPSSARYRHATFTLHEGDFADRAIPAPRKETPRRRLEPPRSRETCRGAELERAYARRNRLQCS